MGRMVRCDQSHLSRIPSELGSEQPSWSSSSSNFILRTKFFTQDMGLADGSFISGQHLHDANRSDVLHRVWSIGGATDAKIHLQPLLC